MAGIHNDYHTPRDTWKNINLSGTKKLLELVYDVAYHLLRTSSRPTFSEAGPKQRQMSNTTLKVTLGVMPSYVGTEIGLKIDAVSDPDGPAARAGIKKGDIIKAVNGKPIKDIYEYMERLGELRRGMTVPVLIERSKSEMTISVTF